MNATEEAKVLEMMKGIGVEMDGLVEVFDTKHVTVLNNVFLFGRHLVHERLQDIFVDIMKIEKGNDLNAIVVSEIGPKGKFAEYIPEMKIMVISLPKLLEGSIETINKRDSNISIAAGIWMNMIYCFCHELYHNISLSNAEDLNDIDEEREEEMAHKYGKNMLEEIQRTMNAEPPTLAELPWFNTRVMEHMIQSIRAGDTNWVKQKEMADTGMVFKSKDKEYTSLREYYKDTSTNQIWENEGAELELKSDFKVTTTDEEIIIEDLDGGSDVDIFKNTCPTAPAPVSTGMTAEDIENLEMQEALSDSAPEGSVIDEGVKRAEEHFKPPAVDKSATDVGQDQMKQTVQQACQSLWMCLYHQMFNNCGWANGRFNTLIDGITKSSINVNVNETLKKIVERFTTITENYIHKPVDITASDGYIFGRLFANRTIPGYEVTFNLNGRRRTLRLVAQNVARISSYAERARQGDRIAWLIEVGVDTYSGMAGLMEADVDTYSALIDNGVYHRKVNGVWTPVDL